MPKKRREHKYKTYDPDKEGYGNPEQWKQAFRQRLGHETTIDKARTILGINKNSNKQEIKNAYRKLAIIYHPDKCGNDTEFKNIAAAYKVAIQNLNIEQSNIIITTPQTNSEQSEFMPQLLNEITENELESYLTNDDYCAQEKFDGHRKTIKVINGNVTTFNKKGKSTGAPENIEQEANNFRNCIIDGELVSDIFHYFDILSLDDTDIRNHSYKDRYQTIFRSPSIIPVDTAYTTEEKRNLFNRLKRENKEGIVFKKLSGIHHTGYHDDHVKFKFYATASVIVIRQNEKASVGIGVYHGNNLIEVGNVTTLGHTKPNINEIIEVRYLYAYRGGSLYQPNLIGPRDDLDHADCTIGKLKFKNEET